MLRRQSVRKACFHYQFVSPLHCFITIYFFSLCSLFRRFPQIKRNLFCSLCVFLLRILQSKVGCCWCARVNKRKQNRNSQLHLSSRLEALNSLCLKNKGQLRRPRWRKRSKAKVNSQRRTQTWQRAVKIILKTLNCFIKKN